MGEINKPLGSEVNLLQDIETAKQTVLKLPGAEKYIQAGAEKMGLAKMVQDVTSQIHSEGYVKGVIQMCGWSDAEATEILSQPDRRPFKSKLSLAEEPDIKNSQLASVGNYLRLKYLKIKADLLKKQEKFELTEQDLEDLGEAKGSLKQFWDFAVSLVAIDEADELDDDINGIDYQDRKKGEIQLKEEWVQKIQDMVETVVGVDNQESAEVYDLVMKVVEGGKISLAWSYLFNKKGDDRVRKVLEMICEEQARDGEATVRKLQLLWKVTVFNMAMGMDLETVYEVNDFPIGDQIEASLTGFMNRKDLVEEMIGHIERVSPVLAENARAGRIIDLWDLLKYRAEVLHLTDEVASIEELKAKASQVSGLLEPLLPMAFKGSSKSMVELALRRGAITRAYTIAYYNQARELVNIALIDPRETFPNFAKSMGHEVMGHKLHYMLIEMAKKAGELPESTDAGEVPRQIREEIAKLAEKQAEQLIIKEEDKVVWSMEAVDGREYEQTETKEWSEVFWAYTYRRQVPLALTQRAVQKKLEARWKQGRSDDLTDQEALAIIEEIKPLTEQWYSEGLLMRVGTGTVLNNIRIWNPLDGLVYMRQYMPERTRKIEIKQKTGKKEENQSVDLGEAFEKRFGRLWITNKQAVAVFLCLMIETANPKMGYDLVRLYDFAANTKVDKQEARLKRIGITKEDLGIDESNNF